MQPPNTSPHVEYIFNAAQDRERLVRQYDLQKGIFDDGFEGAVSVIADTNDLRSTRLGVLDMGCGEGLYAEHIAHEYPNARIVGYDREVLAIETASATFGDGDRVQFFQHNANDPLPTQYVPEGGFDIAVSWLLLLHIKEADLDKVLHNTLSVLRDGGILMYLEPAPHLLDFPHPSLMALYEALTQASRAIGGSAFALHPQQILQQAGFRRVEERTIHLPLGGMTPLGKKNLRHLVASYIAVRDAVTRTLGIMPIEEFDHHVNRLMNDVTTDTVGTGHMLLGYAMK